MREVEHELGGGVANAGRVTRDGGYVLRPSNPHTRSIHTFLTALRGTGFEGASLPVDVQPDGRECLRFIEGDVAIPPFPAWAQTDESLASIAQLMHRFHRASALVGVDSDTWSDEMADPAGGPIVCHNDVCLENVVFRDGEAVGLLDFDFAAPGRPIYDLAQFARMCVPIDDDLSSAPLGWVGSNRPARLRLIADTYGLDLTGRREMLHVLDHAMEHGGSFVQRRVDAGDPNFIRMLDEMGGMERYRRRARWWHASRATFDTALS